MKIFKTKNELYKWNKLQADKVIGFVPTMGALHRGHLSLIKAAKKECEQVVVSIFVNKLQFDPNEDFEQYPRTIEQDIKKLQDEGTNVLFCPLQKEIYPNNPTLKINEINISRKLEGSSRPNFFSGVLTVVLKLFNLVQPSIVYFGEKDIQQLCVIKKMVAELNMPIIVRSCPTVREESGLAMSSRNQYLTVKERQEAAMLYCALSKGAQLIKQNENIKTIKTEMIKILQNKNIIIDYLAVVELDSFEEIKHYNNQSLLIAGAIYYNKIRLIDNIIIR